MSDQGSPEFPAAKDDDDDDVAWNLSTAAVQWKRGSRADAVVWLRRAVDAALAVEATWRAAELTRQTDELEAHLMSGAAAEPISEELDADDLDSADVIDAEEVSPLPDEASERPAPLEALSADSTDEVTDITPDGEQPGEIEEVVEIGDEDISDDDIVEEPADDEPARAEEIGDALPRFPSEAPTATFEARREDGAEADAELEVEEAEPDTVSEPEPLYEDAEEDPAPTPVRLSVAEAAGAEEVAEAEVAEAEVAEAEVAEAAEVEAEEPYLAGISLAEVRGFEDFPPETQLSLAKSARVERLATEEEVSGFGLALVLRGGVSVMPAIADVACGAAGERELIYGRGTLQEGVALRLVATAPDTQIAVWDFESIEPALADCPWVLEELQTVADKYQALAGVSMGPMGERLDDSLRGMVLSRCQLVRLLPGEVLVERGKPVGGLYIVGAGRIELGNDAASAGSEGELGPGEFLFAPQVLAAGAAPTAARAGASGALLMAADRHAAHELMVSVPPLLELLAG